MNVLLRHASGRSGAAEPDIETILTEAATGKRRIWVNSILFAELRPSAFVAGRFSTLVDFARYLRSVATFVSPDPNTMLRAARLRDVQWRRPAERRRPEEQPQFLSLIDAVQLASALWVKEAAGVADLEFLAFEDFGRRRRTASGCRFSACRTSQTSSRWTRTCSRRCGCRAPNRFSAHGGRGSPSQSISRLSASASVATFRALRR